MDQAGIDWEAIEVGGCPVCFGGDCRECGRRLTWGGMHWQHHSDKHHEAWRRHLMSVITRQLRTEYFWRLSLQESAMLMRK